MASLLTIYVRPQNGSAPAPDLCETLHRYCIAPLALFFGRKIAVGKELRQIPVADRINTLGLALIAFFLLQATPYPVALLFATVAILSTTGYVLNSLSISRHVLSQRFISTTAKAQNEKEPSKKEKPAPTKLSMGRFLMRADDITRLSTLSELLPSEEYRKALAEVLHEQPQYLPYIIRLCMEHRVVEIIFAACTEKAHFVKILAAFKDDSHKNDRVLLGLAFAEALNSRKIHITPFFEFLQDVEEKRLLELFPFRDAKYYSPLLIIHLCKRSDAVLQKIRPLLGHYLPSALDGIKDPKDFCILGPFVATKHIRLFAEEATKILHLQPRESLDFKQKLLHIMSGPKTIFGVRRVDFYEGIHACKTQEDLARAFEVLNDNAEEIALFFHFAFLKEELREPAKGLFKSFIKPLEKEKFEQIFPIEVMLLMDASFTKDCLPLLDS